MLMEKNVPKNGEGIKADSDLMPKLPSNLTPLHTVAMTIMRQTGHQHSCLWAMI
jgi:hypothetical protein